MTKSSFKTTTLIAAIATTLFMILSWLLAPLEISDFGGNVILWVNKMEPLYCLCFVSYILMCATFYKSKLDLTGVSVVSRIISGVFIVIFTYLLLVRLRDKYLDAPLPGNEAYRIVYYYILRYSVLIVLWCMYIFYDKLGIQECLINQTQKFRKYVLVLAVILSVALTLHIIPVINDVVTSDTWLLSARPMFGRWSIYVGILRNLLHCAIYITFICLCWKILFFKEQQKPLEQ